MSDQQKPPVELDLDFGAPTSPAADDPLASLATDLATQIEADVARKRERETARQVELLRERGLGLEVEATDSRAVEVDLRAATLDFEADDGVTVSRRVIREEARSRSRLGRTLGRITALLAPVFSLGPNPEHLPRVARGLVARGVAGVATAGLIGTLLAGAPGSAYDLTYAPEAALVTYRSGFAPLLANEETVPNATGLVDPATAVGLTSRVRAFAAAFDSAATSGVTGPLEALFADPSAASSWAAAAMRLAEQGATRSYPYVDPHTASPLFFPEPGGVVMLAVGGPVVIIDRLSSGEEVKRIRVTKMVFRFRQAAGEWQLLEVALIA